MIFEWDPPVDGGAVEEYLVKVYLDQSQIDEEQILSSQMIYTFNDGNVLGNNFGKSLEVSVSAQNSAGSSL